MSNVANILDKLCLAWSGDFESLKQFVADELKLDGVWSHSGADKKVFNSGTLVVISWRKNKSLLFIEGDNSNYLKRKICRYFCEGSTELSHNLDDVEELKQSQLVNTEAIRTLSDSILRLTTGMQKIHDFIDNNKKFFSQTKPRNIAENPSQQPEYVNQAHICDGNEEGSNKPIVIEQSAICIEDTMHDGALTNDRQSSVHNVKENELNDATNLVNSLNLWKIGEGNIKHNDVANSPIVFVKAASSFNSFDHRNKQATNNNNQATYAEVVVSSFASNNTCNALEKPPSNTFRNNSRLKIIEPASDSPDGFVGVDRKRKKVKKFLLSGIDDNVKESQILSYLMQRNVTPTFISVFPSKRKGTISAKIRFRLIDCTVVDSKISGLNLSTASLGNQRKKLENIISPTKPMGSFQPMYNATNRSQSLITTTTV